ncbi:MAG: DUF1214 domain-containing protein [Acidimicrobiia bacterium]|nr:DUF1214 domain-containing protein [Acidimicrobiia bacterium]
MQPTRVSVDNFARAESDRMLAAISEQAGGVNVLGHNRVPTPLDMQTVIRMNRDTLYSFAVVDLADGATLTVPPSGDRYVSVMIVNQDHFINRIFHDAGEYRLTIDEFDTRYVLVAVRVFVDPADAADVAAANGVQDGFAISAASAELFILPVYDEERATAVRTAILELARFADDFDGAFGSKDEVDPVRHLLGSAGGWGGLPLSEAKYLNVDPGLPVGEYRLTVRDVPVDAFWSISLYNADGFFEANELGVNSINNVTATPNPDGSVTVHFGGCGDGRPNCLPIMGGWNYTVRLYKPRPEVLDGSWSFPAVEVLPG